jgi:5-methylcytosine-specific restriction endonuclease McrA
MTALYDPVLRLNKSWLPIGECSVKQSLVAMAGGDPATPPALGLQIEYDLDDSGNPILDKMSAAIPLKWDEWIKLDYCPWRASIKTAHLRIRVPTVIIAQNFNKMPNKKFKPTSKAIWERDGGHCQYTNRPLSKQEANIDHIIPKSRGGSSSWTNLVLTSKEINGMKDNRTPDEAGLKLIRTPTEPAPIPMSLLIRKAKHCDWRWFLTNHQ